MTLNKRLCKGCGEPFQKTKPLQYCCSVKCSISYAKHLEHAKKHNEWLHRKKDLKKSLETKSDVLRQLQGLINELIRIIDYDQLCISSQRIPIKKNAGHLYSVGAHPKLRFNLFNIFVQSERDNCHLSGNQLEYLQNIRNIFGVKVYDEIVCLPLQCKDIEIDKIDLVAAIETTRECISYHKKEYPNVKLNQRERLSLRQLYQKRIGLYPGLKDF